MLRAPFDAIRWWNAWWVRRATHWKGAYYSFAVAFVLFSLTGAETTLIRIVVASASIAFSVGMGFWFARQVLAAHGGSLKEPEGTLSGDQAAWSFHLPVAG